MELNMGRELESRLEKIGIHKMSLKDMLRIAEKNGDSDAIARIKKLISSDAMLLKTGRGSAIKTIAGKVPKKTGASKPLSKTRSRSTGR